VSEISHPFKNGEMRARTQWRRPTRFITAAEILRLKGLLIQHIAAAAAAPALPSTNLLLLSYYIVQTSSFYASAKLWCAALVGFAIVIRQHVCAKSAAYPVLQYSKVCSSQFWPFYAFRII